MSFGHLNHGKPPLEVTVVTGEGADIVQLPAGGAITSGQVMAITAAGTVVQAVTSAAAIGVALEDITADEATAGASVRVCVSGVVQGVAAIAGVLINTPVYSAAAGQVDDLAAASVLPAIGVALTAEAGNGFVTMYWFRKL